MKALGVLIDVGDVESFSPSIGIAETGCEKFSGSLFSGEGQGKIDTLMTHVARLFPAGPRGDLDMIRYGGKFRFVARSVSDPIDCPWRPGNPKLMSDPCGNISI